jgi:D-lactate dehydrogenase
MNAVIFYEAFDEEVSAIKKFLPDNIHAVFTPKTIQEQKDVIPPAELISIRTQSRIPKDWSKRLQGILTRSQGYDHLTAFQREAGANIPCGYLDDYCARAAAEQAVLMMMALMRKLRKQLANFQTFSRDGITGTECKGRRVFVTGVGHIGSEIVDIARGLRMEVKGFDIENNVKNLSYVSLAEGMAWADVVFCALPLTDETRGMIGYEVLKKGNPGKIFVNVSRGEIAPAGDLKRLLDEGVLSGVGLDVFPEEADLADRLRRGIKSRNKDVQTVLDLAIMDEVLFTPHNAFNTQEALEQKAALSAQAVKQFLARGTFPLAVPSP